MKKIGILTSGGDSPGMNAAIRAVVRTAIARGITPIGIYGGYGGILEGEFEELKWHEVGRIIHRGGTLLGTGRHLGFKNDPAVRKQAADILRENGIEGLVVIGGDGSLKGALSLWRDYGISVVGIPGTIDNDINGTDFTLGTDTALNLGVRAMEQLRYIAEANKRVFVVEMFGNRSGYLVTLCGLAAGALRILVPEKPVGEVALNELADKIQEMYSSASGKKFWADKSRNAIVLLAEGAVLEHLGLPEGSLDHNQEKVNDVRNRIEAKLKEVGGDCRIVNVGYIQRGGGPSAFDRYLGTRLGSEAVLVLEKWQGGFMVGLRGSKVAVTPLQDVLENNGSLQQGSSQDADLRNLIRLQEKLSQLDRPVSDNSDGKKILILTSGVDSPGMSHCIRAVVRLAIHEGWNCYGAEMGFSTFLKKDAKPVSKLDWDKVHMSKVMLSNSNLGTTRLKDLTEQELDEFLTNFHKEGYDGLVVVGDAYAQGICNKIGQSPRAMPLAFVPASIYNNVPGTDICIGVDTALNNLTTVLDKCKETSIAMGQIQIIQTKGGNSDWLALHAGVAGGAEAVLSSGQSLTLEKISDIANYLKSAFGRKGEEAQKTGIILLNEGHNNLFSAETIREIIAAETEKETSLINADQILRGGPPSAFDRTLSCRLGEQAVENMRKQLEEGTKVANAVVQTSGQVYARSIAAILQDHGHERVHHTNGKKDWDLLSQLSRKPE